MDSLIQDSSEQRGESGAGRLYKKDERVRWWQKETQGPPAQEPESGAGLGFGYVGRGGTSRGELWFITQAL